MPMAKRRGQIKRVVQASLNFGGKTRLALFHKTHGEHHSEVWRGRRLFSS